MLLLEGLELGDTLGDDSRGVAADVHGQLVDEVVVEQHVELVDADALLLVVEVPVHPVQELLLLVVDLPGRNLAQVPDQVLEAGEGYLFVLVPEGVQDGAQPLLQQALGAQGETAHKLPEIQVHCLRGL